MCQLFLYGAWWPQDDLGVLGPFHTYTKPKARRHAVPSGSCVQLSVQWHEARITSAVRVEVVEMTWEYLDLLRIYTKPKARPRAVHQCAAALV